MTAEKPSTTRHFDGLAHEWASLYERRQSFRTRLDLIDRVLSDYLRAGHVVLDYGSGGGVFSALVSGPASWVLAVDPSVEMVQAAKADSSSLERIVALKGAEYCPESVSHVIGTRDCLPTRPLADIILVIAVLEYLPLPTEALAHLSALLQPSGAMLITYPNTQSLLRRLERPVNRCLAALGRLIRAAWLIRREYSELQVEPTIKIGEVVESLGLRVSLQRDIPLADSGIGKLVRPNTLWILTKDNAAQQHRTSHG